MRIFLYAAAALAILPSPAFAEIKSQSDNGFNIVHIATVDASPDVIWKRLITPKDYWSKAHSWSGSTDGFTLDARAGGCFCEVIQEQDAKGKPKTIGSVEHMRVIFAQQGKVLRMQGALGPLQSEAVLGTLTVAINPAKDGGGTTVFFSYVAGGYMRYKVSEIAPAVDKVIGEQFNSLLSPYPATAPKTMPNEEKPNDEEKPADWSLDLNGISNNDEGTQTPSDPGIVKPAVKKPVSKKAGSNKIPAGTKPKPAPAKKPPIKPIDDMSR